MKIYCARANPNNMSEYLCGLLALMKYHSELGSSEERVEFTEIEGTNPLPEDMIAYDFEEKEGETHLSTVEKVIELMSGLAPSVLDRFLPEVDTEETDTVTLGIFENEEDLTDLVRERGKGEVLFIPIFSWKSYEPANRVAKNVGASGAYFAHWRSFADIKKGMKFFNSILGKDKRIMMLLAAILYYRTGDDRQRLEQLTNDEQGVYRIGVEIKKKGKLVFPTPAWRPKPSRVIESPVYSFLLPSYGKKCGISEYHRHQKDGIYRNSLNSPICITFKRLEDIVFYDDALYVNHEFLLYSDPYLSENTSHELEDFISSNEDIKFVILHHTIPDPDRIKDNKTAMMLGRLAAKKNVRPVVYSKTMADNLMNLTSQVSKKRPNIYVADLGMYELPRTVEGTPDGPVLLLGFNSRGKGNEELLRFLLDNTKLSFRAAGRGTSALLRMSPTRVEVVDDYLQEDALIEYMNGCSVVLCNRATEASSSASYRFAISAGMPTVAKKMAAHTLISELSGLELPFFSEYSEIEELVEGLRSEVHRQEFRGKASELVRSYSIGKCFLKIVEATAS